MQNIESQNIGRTFIKATVLLNPVLLAKATDKLNVFILTLKVPNNTYSLPDFFRYTSK